MTVGIDKEIFDQLVSAVERFTRERLIPAEKQVEADDQVPEDIISEVKEMGLYGLSTPQEFGGMEVSAYQEAVLIEKLCYASLSFRSLIGTNVGIGSQGLVMDGTAEQKAQWLPGIASGDIVTSFALTEPDNGSDAGGIRLYGLCAHRSGQAGRRWRDRLYRTGRYARHYCGQARPENGPARFQNLRCDF